MQAMMNTPPAAPVQEPDAYTFIRRRLDGSNERHFIWASDYKNSPGDLAFVLAGTNAVNLYTTPLAAPVQEQSESAYQLGYMDGMAKQRQWVGLTHDEYDAICDKHFAMSDFDFLGEIEAKLKEKNT